MITAPYTVILEADTQPPDVAGLISGSDKKQIVLIGFCHIYIYNVYTYTSVFAQMQH